jgi:pilus assembly protein Flp/PilA
MTAQFNRFINNESGATAIEYALIAAFIGIAITVAVQQLGEKISGKFNEIKTNLR